MNLKIFLASQLAAWCLGDSLASTPQMGWNSWNTFKFNVDEDLVKATADILVSTGLAKLGYNYLNIDDGWADVKRDQNGRLQANATKFPNGIKAVADYVHGRKLKLGIYGDGGIYTCGFYPGSYGYEELDAQTFADWEIDYLKYDNCGGFQANTLPPQERFGRMSYALKNSGRKIFYSLCEWGHQFPWLWADQFSESYRMSGDIYKSYGKDKAGVCSTAYCLNTGYAGVSVLTMIRKMRELSRFQKPGSWADMDMLEVGTGTMTTYQEQTHFTFWAALKSPLIIGADLNNITKASLDILKNKEIIAINRDKLGTAVNYLPDISKEGQYQTWAGLLGSGKSRHIILAQNYGNSPVNISIPIKSIPGLESLLKHSKLNAVDVWEGKKLRALGESIELKDVQVDQVKALVISVR